LEIKISANNDIQIICPDHQNAKTILEKRQDPLSNAIRFEIDRFSTQ